MSHAEPPALAAQRRLVGRLHDPACYPHPVRRIEVIETHISFVVLTGDFAYKIKKAVELGFVDYRSPQRRRFFCDEELRLNRRLAAPLYLDVVSIADRPAGLRIAPAGDADDGAESAVRMVEFDQACRLDHILARGDFDAHELDRLADTIAGFHRAIPAAGADDGFGTPAAIAAPMLANFADLDRLAEAALRPPLAALDAWSRRQHAGLAPVFAQRLAAGRVRECHGDLHLGNMLRLPDGLQVFDGIEFNPQLRWIDVVSEIAFLVMDLAERGRPDYARRFLDAWLQDSGDYAGLAVLPFYLVYRAMVRAKVAAIRAAQAAGAEREAALAEVRAYIAHAGRIVAARPSALVLMHGLSGSGKSHVARAIVMASGAIRIRSDVERKRLAGLAPRTASGSGVGTGLYAAAASEATYGRLAGLVRTIVAAGYAVVVDAAFLERRRRDDFRRLAAELGLGCTIVACRAEPAQLAERIGRRARRGGDASEATPAVLARQQAEAEPLAADELAITVEAGTDGPARDACLAELRRRLGN